MRVRRAAAFSAGAALLGFLLCATDPSTHASAAGNQVDLELVIAVDISGSMDVDEQRVQRDGYAQAFRSPDVIAAIGGGLLGRVAVTYVAWAGVGIQIVRLPWTVIDSKESAYAFADRVASLPLGTYRGTSISDALLYSASLIEKSGFTATRRAIDISGDGPNNMGGSAVLARDYVVAKGITINGLPIIIPGHDPSGMPNLDQYYKNCVIGGSNSFMFAISKLEEFPTAIRRKLIQEIAFEPTPKQAEVTPAQAPPNICAEQPLFFQP